MASTSIAQQNWREQGPHTSGGQTSAATKVAAAPVAPAPIVRPSDLSPPSETPKSMWQQDKSETPTPAQKRYEPATPKSARRREGSETPKSAPQVDETATPKSAPQQNDEVAPVQYIENGPVSLISSLIDVEPVARRQPPVLRDPDERRPDIPDTIFPFDSLDGEPYVHDLDDDEPFGVVGRVPNLPNVVDVPPAGPGMELGGDFFPVEDRWRLGFPQWDRWARGSLTNPYRQSVFKGDYPIALPNRNDIFFEFTGVSDSLFVSRDVAAAPPDGKVNQRVFQETIFTTFDLFQHDNTVVPSPWFLSMTPAFRFIDPSFVNGSLDDTALQTAFLDLQLAVTTDWYDQVRLRVGRQAFASDFLGFVFADANDAARLFWTKDAVRTFGDIAIFNQVQKDAASQFNTFDSRDQQVAIARLQRNDFIFPGFNVLGSVVYNNDNFKQNVDACWLELAWDGRFGRWETAGAFIQAFGHDASNPIAGRAVNANAQLAAVEFAFPLDWIKPKVSGLYASGDKNPNDNVGRGFDSVFDNPNFAGNGFSYINREAMAIGGQTVFNAFSFLPNMRAKAAAPSNFVNPGLVILNAGAEATLTTRLQALVEFNYFQFVHTEPLEKAFGVANVGKKIGLEASGGLIYKPYIVDNLIFTLGGSVLDPGAGISALTGDTRYLYTAFGAVTVVY